MSQPHTVILIGAGHVHLYVAAHAETLIERGARVVLVGPDGFWYSGLATGMLGGMYESADDRVAPQALMEAHGGEFIQDRVETVDAGARRLCLAGGGDLPKLGVFGVSQGAYIHANLLASLEGKPLAEYKPQKRYLAILNLGDGTALSTWGPLWWNGRSSMCSPNRLAVFPGRVSAVWTKATGNVTPSFSIVSSANGWPSNWVAVRIGNYDCFVETGCQ